MIDIPEAYAAGALAASTAGFRIYLAVCQLGIIAYCGIRIATQIVRRRRRPELGRGDAA